MDKPTTHTNNGGEQQPVDPETQQFSSGGSSEKYEKPKVSRKIVDETLSESFPNEDFSKWKNLDYATTEEDIEAIAKGLQSDKMGIEKAMSLPMMMKADDKAKSIPEFNPSDSDLVIVSREFRQMLFDRAKYEPKKERKCLIVLGFPASGKSTILRDYLNEDGGFLEVDTDIARETSYLAGTYQGGIGSSAVQKAASKASKEVRGQLVSEGYNVALPLVGQDDADVVETIQELGANGYSINIVLKNEDPNVCVSRSISRFAKDGRYLPLWYLYQCMKNCPSSWGRLKNEYEIHENTIGGVKIDGFEQA